MEHVYTDDVAVPEETPYGFRIAKALGRWFAYTPESYHPRAERLMDALRAEPPPSGW